MAQGHPHCRWLRRHGGPCTCADMGFTVWGSLYYYHRSGWAIRVTPVEGLLGTKHTRTTSYHPIANGMVERFHRQLKSALKASPHPEHWSDVLHLALLGIHTTLKEDLKCTATELVYGTGLRLPCEFFAPYAIADADPASYVTQLKGAMRALRCTPSRRPSHSSRHPDSSLRSATHVFVRHDAVRKPLQPPYDAPYRVLDRSDRFYTLDLNGRTDSVSVDRLKPAHIDFPIAPETCTPSSSASPTTTPPSQPDIVLEPPATRTTRSGRHVRWPAHLRDFTPWLLAGGMM